MQLFLRGNSLYKIQMKKIYVSLALALCLGASAQLTRTSVITANPVTRQLNTNIAAKTAATTTLMPSTFNSGGCATNTANIAFYSVWNYTATTNYTLAAQGYAFGTNKTTYTLSPSITLALGTPTITDVADRAAQKYNVTGSVNILQILMASAIGEGTGSITGKIYNENLTTKGPGTQVGGSATAALGTLTGYDAITFASPIAITNANFFASVESPAMGGAGLDTLAILSTVAGCSSTDSLSWIYHTVSPASASTILSSGWVSVKKDFSANLDLLIFPVVDITTNTGSISKNDLTLLAAFPNPAANEITINFGLNRAGDAEIEIFDITGKRVNGIKMENLQAGNHTTKVDLSDLNAGVYMYSVKSANAKMFSKFTVTK